ncbi:bifunctional serine/threonine-protein kinase/formylglycine-generating enzyme family protein [Cyanobacterium aponinum AL20118]|uniref:SUMF1/EgtB/PvdO family nonheme iron enzyme n=2 Tax=Cyanobacterium aponinum TaxID=379064 RepID=A0A844GYS8_9CHRO|nr:bifunctional serine/threonine-protein kinase/formylglycine-generating enzyme family protein [Cyanobacterium aponinum]MBD2395756.1 SUMF1/EgtB/PvdO family nonheme iron enzyme [Cyanobacterium aponinum FACHB-4101]MTF39126.1 SUMF1/EgtB/PvdO family nonheme iron enzyme [Cyanobacterium aponinum 0216]PHV62933.1 serine/threonine protein kinase [Cyanobacterium aponinum IPPAS B-1201]WPF90130.1 bifunctional serine/threonine-protein kinase/formylglycine-generating enzyme family protein [Cyanobacterium apo
MSSWKKGKKLNNGQYIVESILLRGGSSPCYRARDVKRDMLVTLKTTYVTKIMEAERGDLAEKLIKQAQQVAQRCQSPCLIKLYPHVFLEDDLAYMVMDYPEGNDLANYIDGNGKLSPEEALKIITKVASAVNILHQNKCLHLDLKPQNIIIEDKTQNPIIVDYGWAVKLFALAARKTPISPNDCFSPPEKIKDSGKLGVYSDIYSLAAILYVLTTAQLPLNANLRSFQDLVPPIQYNNQMSDRFSDAILKGMALDIKQRPQCLKDWLDLFKQAQTQEESSSQEKQKIIEQTEFIAPPPEETVVQRSTQIITPPTITKPKYNYPNIEEFSFETVTLTEEKKLFGFVSKIEKNLTTKKGQYFVEYLGQGVNLEMIFIPSGQFMMGSSSDERHREKDESPQHKVNLNSFYISKYPVTQLQWKTVSYFPKVTRNLKHKPALFRGDALPVERVSWFDVQEFCKRLSKYTGRNYRLPTESEWEYACRGNTNTAFSFGDVITSEVANFDRPNKDNKNKNIKYEKKTTPVDNFYPNPFGLYDVHGNVWEWCEDNYVSSYTQKPKDGTAHLTSMVNQNRVVRGGSWSLSSEYCRSAKRNSYAPDSSYNFIGFRVVCVLD